MLKTILVGLSLLIFFTQPIFAQRELSFGWSEESIQVDSLTRHFRVFIPRECPANAPVVFLFHSGNSSMERIFKTRDGFTEWPNLSEKEKFILVVPNGVNPITGDTDGNNQKWNDCRENTGNEKGISLIDDVEFISKLVDWSKAKLDINKNRIYAAGIGNGGMMVYRLAIEMGDVFAGAAVFFASMPIDSECSEPANPIAMFIMNSKDDPLVPYDGGELIGDRGSVMSAEQTLNYWIVLNHLNPQKRTTKFYEDIYPEDYSRVIKNEFDRPIENPHVVFNVITNAGHVVPSIKYYLNDSQLKRLLGSQNHDLEGVAEAWKFLRKFSLR